MRRAERASAAIDPCLQPCVVDFANMRISDLYRAGKSVISFEFFPPKSETGYRSLFRTIGELRDLEPGFVSVTMGAGGSTRRRTVELVTRTNGQQIIELFREFRDLERAEERVSAQIEARTRALPLFKSALGTEQLGQALSMRRDHPVHALLRRMYFENR